MISRLPVSVSAEPERNAKLVQVAPGLAAQSPVRLTAEDCHGYDVQLEVVAMPMSDDRAGRFVCDRLTVKQRPGGPVVTLAGIRSIPVAELTNMAGAGHVPSIGMTARVMPEDVAANGPTDTALWWVGYIYRLASVVGEPPTKSVREAMELPQSTAGRWVALARERGFLGPSEGPGKVGG